MGPQYNVDMTGTARCENKDCNAPLGLGEKSYGKCLKCRSKELKESTSSKPDVVTSHTAFQQPKAQKSRGNLPTLEPQESTLIEVNENIEPNTVLESTRLPLSLAEKLENLAKEKGIPKAALIRHAIRALIGL